MKISPRCFFLSGLAFIPPWTVNAGFAVGQEKTLVIDSGACYLSAQTVFGYASNVKPQNELLLMNTEHHFDHSGGNSFFADRGIDIYGFQGMLRNDQELIATIGEYNRCIPNKVRRDHGEGAEFFTGTRVSNPNHVIYEDTKMELGELEAQIISTPGHTPTNISIYVPSDQVLFCGDCLVNGYLPNLESGTADDWQVWLKSLDKLQALGAEIVVPGHGQMLQGDRIHEVIDETRRILNKSIRTGIAPTLEEGHMS
ncbi:MAG TPA: MBL fold metallo-hydrolase [Syntrophomonadaceae bacterium]|nr:MBL fold metallo-hydrolase [Syntrophomonadaceae bacterium]